jgi:hypothetical protein
VGARVAPSLLLAALCACAASSAMSGRAPAPLALPELTEYEAPNAVLIPGRLFPLGWSRDGVFAYAYEPPDEACGCYFFELLIQDMVSDKVLWEYRYDSSKAAEGDKLEDIAAVWRAHGGELEARLRDFGIVRAKGAALEPLSKTGPDRLAAELQTTRVEEELSPYGFGYISSYAARVSSARGEKTIFRSGVIEAGLLDVSSPGYLESPFEPRVALVIQEIWRGWEGPPSVARLRLSGCDLRRGWR